MNNDKSISQYDLFSLMHEWLKPFIYEYTRFGGYWSNSSHAGYFSWSLGNSVGTRIRIGGSCLCEDHWKICSGDYKEENVNIKLFNDHIEFIEDSKFTDLTIEKMYNLYIFLNERLFGVKENKEEINNE